MSNESSIRPPRPSLLNAAEELRRLGSHPDALDWPVEALPAVRAAIVAVEGELDALYVRDRQGDLVTQAEPRLIHAVEELQANLAKELVSLWEMKESEPGTVEKAQIADAARRLVELAEKGIGLFYESLKDAHAMD